MEKLNALQELLKSFGSCLVAYSGGVDSTFLAAVAQDVLGQKSLAVIADSPSLPRRELDEAAAVAREFSIPFRVIHTQELADAHYTSNPLNRCYFCKHELFTQLIPLANKEHFSVIAYGENASDVGDFRPGAQAAALFQIRAPLKEVGLTKDEIRCLSAERGLPTAHKPALACLSSRIPYGESVTPEKLRMIEEAEYVLRDFGFLDVRVRHHELGGSGHRPRYLARIELGPSEKSLTAEQNEAVLEAFRRLGYAFVTLDLAGYRRGSLNPQLQHTDP